MSDFSGLEQSFALPALSAASQLDDLAAYAPPTTEVQPHEVSFRRLRGAHEIAGILHLRSEIELPAAVLADASFRTREKKEMKSASWALSSVSARRSARSA
jgi:hypothetical protein